MLFRSPLAAYFVKAKYTLFHDVNIELLGLGDIGMLSIPIICSVYLRLPSESFGKGSLHYLLTSFSHSFVAANPG